MKPPSWLFHHPKRKRYEHQSKARGDHKHSHLTGTFWPRWKLFSSGMSVPSYPQAFSSVEVYAESWFLRGVGWNIFEWAMTDEAARRAATMTFLNMVKVCS